MDDYGDRKFIQSAVVPFRYRNGILEILIITSRKKNRWVLPKGIVESDLSPWESASREAYEEAGVKGEVSSCCLGRYRYVKWGGVCHVDVFSLTVMEVFDCWPESGFRERHWVSLEEAALRMDEKRLKTIILSLPESLDLNHRLRDRFRGALVGTMVGDALGMPVEGWAMDQIRACYGQVRDMLPARLGAGTYTDDTQMMLALSEALLEKGDHPDLECIAAGFGENFDPSRGYGGNTQKILTGFRQGRPWREVVADNLLPGGSFANGAAMRVAPVVPAFYPDAQQAALVAEAQAQVTGHTHPEAVWGAKILALAVLTAIQRGTRGDCSGGKAFLEELLSIDNDLSHPAIRWILDHLDASPEEAARRLGTGLRSVESVPTALWSFLSCLDDPEETVIRAVNMGGDTDTVGAMAGALAGARHGYSAWPRRWLDALENGFKGRDYIVRLADAFFGRTIENQTNE